MLHLWHMAVYTVLRMQAFYGPTVADRHAKACARSFGFDAGKLIRAASELA